jgi:Uma2 family endonuclease
MSEQNVEHCCSVTLIVVGNVFNPDEFTELLGFVPDQCWYRGERKKWVRPDGSVREFDSISEQSGWKLFIPAEFKSEELSSQLDYWIDFIQKHVTALRELQPMGVEIILDLYISTLESAVLGPATLSQLGNLGIALEFTFSP